MREVARCRLSRDFGFDEPITGECRRTACRCTHAACSRAIARAIAITEQCCSIV